MTDADADLAGMILLLVDAARILREVTEPGGVFSMGDVRDWLRAYEAMQEAHRRGAHHQGELFEKIPNGD